MDVQATLLDDLNTRVVVPLVAKSLLAEESYPRLKPVIPVADALCVLVTTDIAAIPLSRLGERVGNVEAAHRGEIVAALDFLIQGF